MFTNITAGKLERIVAKWSKYEVPSGAQNKISELMQKTAEQMYEMISFAGSIDEDTSFALGEKFAEIVMPRFVTCYFIGYELASKKKSHAASTSYLTVATLPIKSMVLNVAKVLVEQGKAHPATLQVLTVQISSAVDEASNDICVLGMEDFVRLGYR